MLGKVSAFWNVFKAGQEVADPALWKNRQVTSNALGAVILALAALAKLYKIDIPIDEETALLIGGGIVALWNVGLTMATSKKIGLPTAPTPIPAPQPEPVLAPVEEMHGRSAEEIRQEAANTLSASMARRNRGYYDDPDTPRNDR